MGETHAPLHDRALAETLQRLEQRLARVEEHLALAPLKPVAAPAPRESADAGSALHAAEAHDEPPTGAEPVEGDLEFVVGQNWLASVGILVLTCGVGFALLLPLAGLPPFVPSLAGFTVAAILLLLAGRWRTSFELVAGYFRGAGMALLYFSTLRLFFFGATQVLDINSVAGRLLLVGVVSANLAVAVRRKSVWLLGLALCTGLITTIAVGAPYFVFVGIALLLALAAYAVVNHGWPWLLPVVIPAGYLAHFVWLINRPWSGRPLEIVAKPPAGPLFVLAYVLIIALGSFLRRDRSEEDPPTVIAVLFNCGGGYGLFLLATMGAAPALFGPSHLLAAVLFLALALAFWRNEASRIATFFYAMTGYLALSVALGKLIPVPNLFIWLSAESLLVVATALWFRSKLIVVGNFFIYLAIVIAYTAVARNESGISIGFGVVALLTARILRWQQERLELKTELMRDAYLASAFVVFPYSLYHLVPRAFVTVSWVSVAVAYYLMNLIVHSPKYRWMGHLTLLLTALYVIVIGIFQLSPAYRIGSFLVLGTVLLVVSLTFTMVRSRRRSVTADR
ncbi:MAG TPA: hypothetical protein VIK25_02715 [Gemmatimonadaceae bacterium]